MLVGYFATLNLDVSQFYSDAHLFIFRQRKYYTKNLNFPEVEV